MAEWYSISQFRKREREGLCSEEQKAFPSSYLSIIPIP
jgi:hypothetical protein